MKVVKQASKQTRHLTYCKINNIGMTYRTRDHFSLLVPCPVHASGQPHHTMSVEIQENHWILLKVLCFSSYNDNLRETEVWLKHPRRRKDTFRYCKQYGNEKYLEMIWIIWSFWAHKSRFACKMVFRLRCSMLNLMWCIKVWKSYWFASCMFHFQQTSKHGRKCLFLT